MTRLAKRAKAEWQNRQGSQGNDLRLGAAISARTADDLLEEARPSLPDPSTY
jgi:hypothetical protein